ncbi:putative ABC transport system permease protein [Candidatus Methanomarinus sp.]|nr:putative ABC transport system permease protein [ANME-2 cluster archaeon]
MVNFIQSLHIAVGSIRSARMRSLLTTLGIVIGVAAVIANVSLGASFQQYFDQEIGILKSLGFTNFNVLLLFIVESVVLSVIGGLLGIGLGVLGAYGAQSLMGLPYVFPVELIIIGFAVSVIVGMIAGAYPANKAAKMNTVDALRSE